MHGIIARTGFVSRLINGRPAFRFMPAADRHAARLLGSLLGQRAWCAALTLAASCLVSLLEAGSMALLAVTVQFFMTGNSVAAQSRLGPLGELLDPQIDGLGQDGLGLSLLILAVLSQLLRCLAQFVSEALSISLATGFL